MYKHVLVPLDGPALAEEALPDAFLLAESFQGELTLLQVIVPFPDDKLRSGTGLDRAIETTTFLPLCCSEYVMFAFDSKEVQFGSPLLMDDLIRESSRMLKQTMWT